MKQESGYLEVIHRLVNLSIFLFVVVIGQFLVLVFGLPKINFNHIKEKSKREAAPIIDASEDLKTLPAVFDGKVWLAPSDEALAADSNSEQLKYGRELIANTAQYFGPKGSVAHLSNGMNCQNCHLQAGTAPFGNNYAAVASTYPKYRGRSGAIEDVYKRVDDCFERSLNGRAPKNGSKEKEALVAYINWLGKDVKKGVKPAGSGIYELAYLNRAASPESGKSLYQGKCQSCHQADGNGKLNSENTAYTYPPLWGKNSFNTGAGLYRLSRMAGYIKTNMPLGSTYDRPQLTDEEAWDIAAYIESMQRPSKNIKRDWPKKEEKPVDHPFGPFSDSFSETEHKFGPFEPIVQAKKKQH